MTMKKATLRLLPLGLTLALLALCAAALRHDPRELPSPLVGRPAPAFAAPALDGSAPGFASGSLKGQVWLLNVWASWCGACRTEHDELAELARLHVPLYGLNYKDEVPAAQAWLAQAGNPYRRTAVDAQGRIGMDFGVYGVPETFVIDRQGVVRFRHAGPLTREVLQQQVLPLIKALSS